MSWELPFHLYRPSFHSYIPPSFLQQLLPILSSDPIPYSEAISISELEESELFLPNSILNMV